MPHELARALQQTGRIWECCALKESHVYMRSEYVDVSECSISQTRNWTAVMYKFPDFVSALSHQLKPLTCNRSQFTCMLIHPRIYRGIPLDSAVQSKQFRSDHLSHMSVLFMKF